MTKQLKKQFKNQSQSGRSMVEMLGVLAIIAILSIGGIVGYKLAMNYYQADQIANEINLMRNDLKVKYALGNEELLLGDPYDDTPENKDYSGHLSTQYDRYPVDYDCIIRGNKDSKNELYNCREADAYYIVVGNISKGVCRPLTTLVAAMDGQLEMDINGTPYTEDDLCDENNEIYVEFDAEDVNGNYDSNRPEGWCAKDGDCEGLSTPVCDKESNTCVECVKEGDCSAPRSVCDVANHECVECIENTDCKDLSRPRCNVEQGNCESCPPEKPIWHNNTCVECETNEDCLMKGTENPICNTIEGKCKPCPGGQEWKESAQGCAAYECRSNEDCDEGEFCMTTLRYQPCEEFSPSPSSQTFSGKCIDVNSEKAYLSTAKFYYSQEAMTWWSAERFCKALNKQMATRSLLNCSNHSDSYCTESDIEARILADLQSTGELGTVDALSTQTHFWLEEIGSCNAYHACYDNKWIRYNTGKGDMLGRIQALCKE